MLTQEEKNEIYEGVYIGAITVLNLPINLYESTAKTLQKSVYKGYGSTLKSAEIASPEWLLLNDFRENVNIFSGAKTFDQIKESQRLILDESGALRPFNKYLADVKELDAVYLDRWLKTEAQTAVAQAQSARQWMEFERDKDLFPLLIYHTQGDEKVRLSHAILDGFTAPVNDSYWSSIQPINDYGCRCWVEQLEKGERSSQEWEEERVSEYNKEVSKYNETTRGKKLNEINTLKDVPEPLFKMNPAKDRLIFKNEGIGSHPYFKVDEAFEVYKNANFGMDINYGL